MSTKEFYSKAAYKLKQSEITRLNWQKGKFNFLVKAVNRKCRRPDCDNDFDVKPSDPKKFCSQNCAAIFNNSLRILSIETKSKISKSLTGKKYPERVLRNLKAKIPEYRICENPSCQKEFLVRYWRPKNRLQRFCSVRCAVHVTGSKTTSPRAARAKAGIRPDIDPKVCFYSRWEANYARVLNFREIKWVHQPKRFKLESQYYTPDFYLPKSKTYVEIKNFLSDYSRNRDTNFRKLYPKEKLKLILKEEYKRIERKYAPLIKNWEYS